MLGERLVQMCLEQINGHMLYAWTLRRHSLTSELSQVNTISEQAKEVI
jgi:hypothetical protein